jgi:hypothetical protein
VDSERLGLVQFYNNWYYCTVDRQSSKTYSARVRGFRFPFAARIYGERAHRFAVYLYGTGPYREST